jgi:hypothetical protein
MTLDLDFLRRDINKMNVYDYCAIEDVDNCLEILLKTHMLDVDDLFTSLDYSIFSKNLKTFKLLIKIMKHNFNTKDDKVRNKVIVALEKMVNLFRFSHFLFVLNDEDLIQAFEDLIFSENLMIRFILSVEIVYKQYEDKINTGKSNQPNTNHNIDFEEIISSTKIREKRDQILISYLRYLNNLGNAVPLSFMKTLIYANLHDIFYKCYNHNLNTTFPNEETIIFFDKDNYCFRLPKSKRIEDHSLCHFWVDSINYINTYNILFIALLNDNQEYTSHILKNDAFDKFFFKKSRESHNILHIIFSSDNLSKFKLIISKFECLCEKLKLEKYIKINELLNENDDHLLLPIDTALRKRNYNVLSEYSDYMTSKYLCNIETFPEKIIDLNSTYKLLDIEITETKEIFPSKEYFEINEKCLSEISTISSQKALSINDMFYSLNFLDKKYCFSLINQIISKIDDNTIEKDFHIKSVHYLYDM